MYQRFLATSLRESLLNPLRKVIILYGARQVGKTTLVNTLLDGLPLKSLRLSADDRIIEAIFASRDLVKLDLLTKGYDLVFLDEAQRIPEVGLSLKLLHDQRPGLRIIITGSSSLEMASRTKESLAGRTRTFNLHPLSLGELALTVSPFELDRKIEELLTFGSYPEVFAYGNATEKARYLAELGTGILYKDILELLSLKHSSKLRDLLRLLAFQVGSQVSLSELGTQLFLSKDTVSHYIDLLEQSFIIFRLRGFSRNLRKEMGKMDKIYFYDLGIRNSVIDNHKGLEFRDDVGHLWENFLIVERMKYRHYHSMPAQSWFWRTQTGAELDLVEEHNGQLSGFGFKWSDKRCQVPKTWLETYPGATWTAINRKNYQDWVL